VTDADLPTRIMQVQSRPDAVPATRRTAAEVLAVYDLHYDRLVRIAYLTTGSSAIAEDIVQDAFMDALRRWEHIRDPPAYLRRAVINRSTSWLRRLIRERRHLDASTLYDVVWHDADTLAVTDTIRHLPPRQRAAVILRYVDGLSETEIADALGCRPGTVKSLLSRSRASLKAALSNDN